MDEMALRALSAFGSWGAWAYACDDGTRQLASIGGLAAVDLWLGSWAEAVYGLAEGIRMVVGKEGIPLWEGEEEETDGVTTGVLVDVEVGEETPLNWAVSAAPALEEGDGRLMRNDEIEDRMSKAAKGLVQSGGTLILLLSVVAYGSRSATAPPSSDAVRHIVVGCVSDLPGLIEIGALDFPPRYDERHGRRRCDSPRQAQRFFAETVTLMGSHAARVVVWLKSPQLVERPAELVERARNVAAQYGAYVGITFYAYGDGAQSRSKVGREGAVLNYTKKHPVPIVESSKIYAGDG
ncbi:hypothetical protein HK101_006156 [Irineochytrium annulatum]|nr:hypothetical protein HK101_006156 [Irineochytrium annulatum]